MDKARVLTIMILVMTDIEFMEKSVAKVEEVHQLDFEKEILSKIRIMLNKKKAIVEGEQIKEQEKN